MKKTFLLLAGCALIAFASCAKVCSCTEKNSNVTVSDVDLKGQSVYKNCTEYQKALNDTAAGAGLDQNWSCTAK
jgi:hypothetical protein